MKVYEIVVLMVKAVKDVMPTKQRERSEKIVLQGYQMVYMIPKVLKDVAVTRQLNYKCKKEVRKSIR